jgi:hypothetical protein
LNELHVASVYGNTGSIGVLTTLSVQQIQNTTNNSAGGPTGPSETIDYDWSTGDVFYIYDPPYKWTANITNLPVTGNKTYGVVFIIEQGATANFIDNLQIAGTGKTILWSDATAPTATANRTEVESFTLYYSGSSNWTVMGQYSSFGS